MEKKTSLKRRLNRVDYQVSLMIALIVSLSFLCVYYYNYNVTYNDMLYTLKERSDNIYSVVENEFNPLTFEEIDNREDVDKELYLKDKQLLEYIKDSTGVMYLYTATKTKDGNFIYVLDGLSSESPDFRYPGDLIEKETIPELEHAYENKIVYPEDIKSTSWGKIFVSYYPIHKDNEVIGVIGIEFDAQHQYDTFRSLRIMTPIIGGVFALVAIIFAVYLFRRISNPFYRDFANTDYLTGIQNRNAFELYMRNLQAKETYHHFGFISIDLNNLKMINDTLGHQAGDKYIRNCADLLKRFESEECILYRIGGDEFAFIVINTNLQKITDLRKNIIKSVNLHNLSTEMQISIAVGEAVFEAKIDEDLSDTLKRADQDMYDNKKVMKKHTEK